MYTNTPLDNHWDGTYPFFIVDPTKDRNLFHGITAATVPVWLWFGIAMNAYVNCIQIFIGNEKFAPGRLVYPL